MMSYKTTRIYEVRLLDRLLDFDSLVENTIGALSSHTTSQPVEGFIGCTLSIVYPDLDLLDRRKGGWRRRVKRFTERLHRRFADVDWAITRMEGQLFDTLDFDEDDPPHEILSAVRHGKYQLSRPIQIMVPLKESLLSTLLSFRVLLNLTLHDAFQYADSVHIRAWVTNSTDLTQEIVHQERAARVPYSHWLRSDNLEDATEYYDTPGIAEAIVEECRGHYMNADQAEPGERKVRRYTYFDGNKEPLQVDSAEDLKRLVEELRFCAFYTSVETLGEKVGRVCLDLDSHWLLRSLLGADGTWNLQCDFVNALLSLVRELELPVPAVKFSGSRGVHVFWNVAPDAVGDEVVEVEPYSETILALDPDIPKRKTTQMFVTPFGSLRTLMHGLVLHLKQRRMEWSRVPLSNDIVQRMGLRHKVQLISTGREVDRREGKVVVDVISQRKGVFRSTLSPHYKTGLVSRSMLSPFGQIDTRFLMWDQIKDLCSRESVMLEMQDEPDGVVCRPGVLERDDITRIADVLRGDVFIVAKFSAPDASELTPTQYQKYHERYSEDL